MVPNCRCRKFGVCVQLVVSQGHSSPLGLFEKVRKCILKFNRQVSIEQHRFQYTANIVTLRRLSQKKAQSKHTSLYVLCYHCMSKPSGLDALASDDTQKFKRGVLSHLVWELTEEELVEWKSFSGFFKTSCKNDFLSFLPSFPTLSFFQEASNKNI